LTSAEDELLVFLKKKADFTVIPGFVSSGISWGFPFGPPPTKNAKKKSTLRRKKNKRLVELGILRRKNRRKNVASLDLRPWGNGM